MGKVIVITGGSSGIGAASAKRLAAEGHSLVLAARGTEQLAAIVKECGANAIGVPTDVTKRTEVNRLRDAAIAKFGHIDVWINNAGRGITRDVLDLTDEDLDAMFLINVKSALYGIQAIVPYFKSRGEGHLINISTVLSRVPGASFRVGYSASKAALNVLTSVLRMDLQKEYPRIFVSLVMPGGVATNFQKNAIGGTPGGGPVGVAPPQAADEVAAVIAGVMESKAPEVYTSAVLDSLAHRYYSDVEAFERARVSQASK
jgi:NAD(P)-dependent dehydrogenase (short-subunit alcohol dehydrogenase family)